MQNSCVPPKVCVPRIPISRALHKACALFALSHGYPMAHSGGHYNGYLQAIEVARKHENVYVFHAFIYFIYALMIFPFNHIHVYMHFIYIRSRVSSFRLYINQVRSFHLSMNQ